MQATTGRPGIFLISLLLLTGCYPSPRPGAGPTTDASSDPAPIKVRSIEFDPARYPLQQLPPGDILGDLAFIDASGENHVVFTRTELSRDEHVYTSVLRIKHVVRQNDTVNEVRTYTERIDDCEFDVVLEPKFGEWSISDVDNDGIGELSMGYTADCISDISPLIHKVLVTEGGEKYALRGQTYLEFPGMAVEGGKYIADEMPPAFLQQARQVWERTARN